MTLLRRLAYAALVFAYVHIVFGAIVRITGSGLGCGDHWPKCYGAWFPPFSRMDLVIEVTHRYLAFGLSVTILGLLAMAMLRRREPGVAGRGGVLRAVALAFGLVVLAAVLGGVVVKLELTNPHVIVAHLGIAMALIGALAAATVRAGGLGARALPDGGASARTWRGARIAAGLALVAVVLGGLTAHLPGANSACIGFPHCRETASGGEALAVHVVHRIVAFILLFHALGVALGVRKRGEAPLVRRLAWAAFGVILLQILVAAVLVELRLPAVWRSLHQAVGTGVWLATLLLALVARRGARRVPATGADGPELRRPVAAATAAAMLAVDPVSATESHAAEPWTEQPPVAEARGLASSGVDDLAAAGIILVDEASVERSVVEMAVEPPTGRDAETDLAIAPDQAPAIGEARDPEERDTPHELDRVDDASDTGRIGDEDRLDANAAAELERRPSESREPMAGSTTPAVTSAPAPRRPPTLAVIIARGADF